MTYGWVIGRGGLGFMSKKPFQIEADINMRIYFASDGWFKKTEWLEGRVRWVKPISQSYAMGIEFNEPIGDDQPDLLSYIEAGDYHGRFWRHEIPPVNSGSL